MALAMLRGLYKFQYYSQWNLKPTIILHTSHLRQYNFSICDMLTLAELWVGFSALGKNEFI